MYEPSPRSNGGGATNINITDADLVVLGENNAITINKIYCGRKSGVK
jgi:hypothetical protein